jgi:hypothetical protein
MNTNVRTQVRVGGGGLATNHSEAPAVRTEVRAGGSGLNHSQSVSR